MSKTTGWIDWIVELQSLAQIGLTYCKDVYDRERYERLREISAEMMACTADLPLETVKGLFCSESGYQTPKIDTRAAIFKDDKILLVQENNGSWSLPGGWCDVNVSVGENTVKEVWEEAGLEVVSERLIAVQDRAKHNLPRYAYGVCKVFVLCSAVGGAFRENSETLVSIILQKTDCPPSPQKRTPKNKSACALRPTAPGTHGKPCWNNRFTG